MRENMKRVTRARASERKALSALARTRGRTRRIHTPSVRSPPVIVSVRKRSFPVYELPRPSLLLFPQVFRAFICRPLDGRTEDDKNVRRRGNASGVRGRGEMGAKKRENYCQSRMLPSVSPQRRGFGQTELTSRGITAAQ